MCHVHAFAQLQLQCTGYITKEIYRRKASLASYMIAMGQLQEIMHVGLSCKFPVKFMQHL